MSKYPRITHVIYDLDGLLLDTEIFYSKVDSALVSRYGKIFDEVVKSKIAGMKAQDVARILVETLELPVSPQEYLEERQELLFELFPQALPFPGAIRLTKHLHKHGIPQAIASSSVRRSFERKITNHRDWFAIFDCIVLGDDPDVKQGKPAPDTFVIAAQRLQAKPENCLVFEDAPAGVESARAAGMSVVAIANPNFDRNLYQNANYVLNSLTEFEPKFWHLPPFDT